MDVMASTKCCQKLLLRVRLKNIHQAENASFGTCFSRLFRAINPIIPRKRALSQNQKSAIFISGNVFQTHANVAYLLEQPLHRPIQGKEEMKSGKKQDRPEKNRRPYWLLRSGEAARRG
jgi:hypothetical protein